MTDHEVERALGYTPCVCGVIDGTWHWRCYRGKTDAELKAGIALAFRNARRHLKKQRAEALRVACGKTPNAAGNRLALQGQSELTGLLGVGSEAKGQTEC